MRRTVLLMMVALSVAAGLTPALAGGPKNAKGQGGGQQSTPQPTALAAYSSYDDLSEACIPFWNSALGCTHNPAYPVGRFYPVRAVLTSNGVPIVGATLSFSYVTLETAVTSAPFCVAQTDSAGEAYCDMTNAVPYGDYVVTYHDPTGARADSSATSPIMASPTTWPRPW
jgi:hypothetical protein